MNYRFMGSPSVQMKLINEVLLRRITKPALKFMPAREEFVFIPKLILNTLAHFAFWPAARYQWVEIKEDKLHAEVVSSLDRRQRDPSLEKAILYIHGGGYVFLAPATHRGITSYLAYKAGCTCVVPQYRLSPYAEFPSALEDIMETYKWMLKEGYKPENITIAGDSAGGNAALVVTKMIMEAGLPKPASVVGLSPWCDMSDSSDSLRSMAKDDPFLPADRIADIVKIYAGKSRMNDLRNPKLSPMFEDFTDFPPTMFSYGELEILSGEAHTTIEKIKADTGADHHVELVTPLGAHVFHFFIGIAPESREALDQIARFLRKHWSY